MSVRISFAQAALAAIYASPLMALPVMAVSNNWFIGAKPSQFVGPFILGTLMFWIPTALSNIAARGLVCWLGAGLSGVAFHLTIGLVAGVLLVWVVDFVARGTTAIGGGAPGWPMLSALVLGAIFNAGMIYAVWYFGWKSAYD